MTCAEVRALVGAYADGELDPAHQLEVGRHLEACAACAAALARQEAVRQAFRGAALYQAAPPGLRERVRAAVGARRPRRRVLPAAARGWIAVAASVALVILVGWLAVRVGSVPSGDELVAQEVVASHVRSLMAVEGHLVDKPSSNEHTVKPWFNGRVDFAPEVKRLEAKGFSLVGGRLDYLDQTKVAAVVYQRRQHKINLFEWATPDRPDQAPRSLTVKGYHTIHWTRAGLTYWAVSDLNEAELQEFVRLVNP